MNLYLLKILFLVCLEFSTLVSFNNVDITSSINVSCNITHQNINCVDNVELCFVKESSAILTPNTRINFLNLNNTIIDGFLARNQIINYVPQFDHQIAQKLRMLKIETSKLKTITQNDLKPMINLESLDLTGNEIQKLENQTFRYNSKLIFINLIQNKIKFIGFGIFNNLRKLNRLYLHSNPCFTNGKNAKNQSEVAKLIKTLNSTCKEKDEDGKCNSTDITLPSTSKTRTTKKKIISFKTSKGFTTTIANTNTTNNPTILKNIPKTATKTSNQTFKNESKLDLPTEHFQINSSSHSALAIILMSLILLILIVILILVIYCFISSSKSKARQTNIQQSQNARRISQMNTYDTLPQIKSENESRNDENSIEMNQGTSEIYEDILDYQRSQDEIYQSVLDDICEEDSEEINEIGKEFTGINTNYDDDVYQTVNDELYQEVSIYDTEVPLVVGSIKFSDDTYNNPEDFYDEVANDSKFNVSDDYQEVNQESSSKTDFLQQNVLGNVSEFKVIEASLESEEDLYSESYVDAHQESMDVLYSTVKKN